MGGTPEDATIHAEENIPAVTIKELEDQLKETSRGKAGDQAGLVVEMLQRGSDDLLGAIAMLFTELLSGRAQPPNIWKQSVITILFKKGDATLPDNYRPITLLRIMYKLFSRVLNARIKQYLDARQGPDQAGFRKEYGCDDNLFTVVQIIEKLAEFQLPLWIAAIDFRKAFDSVEHFAIWNALQKHGVPNAYTSVLQKLYSQQTGKVITPAMSREFKLERGTKQGDPMSPALFNAVLEEVFNRLQPHWRQKGWGIRLGTSSEDLLCNLRFADDILLLATSRYQLKRMLEDLITATREIGLEMHNGKTKILRMDGCVQNSSAFMEVAGMKIEVLSKGSSTMYLGRLLSVDAVHDTELDHRLEKAWKNFFAHKAQLCNRSFRLRDRLRLFESVVTSSVLYGSGCWTMTQSREQKLRTTQRKMLRWIVGVGRKQRAQQQQTTQGDDEGEEDEEEPEPLEEQGEAETKEPLELEDWVVFIRRATNIAEEALAKVKLEDWIAGQRRRKWRWAGHAARRHDNRWSNRVLHCIELDGKRPQGHPKTRWRDAIESFFRNHTTRSGRDWLALAQNGQAWKSYEDKFVHFAI